VNIVPELLESGSLPFQELVRVSGVSAKGGSRICPADNHANCGWMLEEMGQLFQTEMKSMAVQGMEHSLPKSMMAFRFHDYSRQPRGMEVDSAHCLDLLDGQQLAVLQK